MSNTVFFNARVQCLVLVGAGQLPTVPANPQATPLSVGWLSTDIMFGEIAVNITDNKIFTRTSSGILEITGGGGGGTGSVIDKGLWDASGGTLPNAVGIKYGWEYRISVAGIVGGVDLLQGMIIRAKVDDPGQNIANYYYR